MSSSTLLKILGRDAAQEISAVENLEEQFIALLAIFTHQGAEVFHCRCLDLLEAIESIYLSDGVENIVASRHFLWTEVTRAFGDTGFLCHNDFCNLRVQSYCKMREIQKKELSLHIKIFQR